MNCWRLTVALINTKKEALSILGQAASEYRGTKQDHLYLEAALEFIDSALGPHEDSGEDDQDD